MIEIKAKIDPMANTVTIVRDKQYPFIDPLQELNDWLDATSQIAQRAMKYQEMNKRDMVNYCGNYLKGKI